MYTHRTDIGIFNIIFRNHLWHVLYETENLGGYHTPQQALNDLLVGHTFALTNGLDTSKLNFPKSIEGWAFINS